MFEEKETVQDPDMLATAADEDLSNDENLNGEVGKLALSRRLTRHFRAHVQ